MPSLADAVNSNQHAEDIYQIIVECARTPYLYQNLAIQDHVLTRFELLALFLSMALRHLRNNQSLSQELVDLFVSDMDACVRELPVGDLKVGKEVKRLVRAFYGRLMAYHQALTLPNAQQLMDILERNLFVHSSQTSLACRQNLITLIFQTDLYLQTHLNNGDLHERNH